MRLPLVMSPFVVLALAGCASTGDSDGTRVERHYVTGSNVARRVDQPTGSPTYGISGDDLRKGKVDMPNVIPPPPDHRSPGN